MRRLQRPTRAQGARHQARRGLARSAAAGDFPIGAPRGRKTAAMAAEATVAEGLSESAHARERGAKSAAAAGADIAEGISHPTVNFVP